MPRHSADDGDEENVGYEKMGVARLPSTNEVAELDTTRDELRREKEEEQLHRGEETTAYTNDEEQGSSRRSSSGLAQPGESWRAHEKGRDATESGITPTTQQEQSPASSTRPGAYTVPGRAFGQFPVWGAPTQLDSLRDDGYYCGYESLVI